MIRKKGLHLCISLILSAAMALGMTGCGGNRGTQGKENQEGGIQEEAGNDRDGSASQTMGRYMETEIDLGEHLSRPVGIVQREDGSLLVFDYNNGVIRSEDEGLTWNPVSIPWLQEERMAENYVMDVAVSPISGYGVITSLSSKEEGYSLNPVYYYVDEEGNKTFFDIPYDKDSIDYIKSLFFSPDGKLFGAALGGKLYELNKEDGTYKEIYQSPATIWDIIFAGDIMILCTNQDVSLYDYVKGDLAEKDAVLDDFITQELGDNRYGNTDSKELLMMPGEEENVVYLALDKGLYRHVLGGSAMEQVIDGSLCSLGEPSSYLVSMLRLDNGSFLILYTGSLIRYDYDEKVPSVPSRQITAYSLKENNVLRQAISNFQKKNPDIYVKYEIGMDSVSGITREDALKKLNTEIMAGKGPDFLLMDGLPADSYIEKGLLADISPYIADMEQNDLLLDNILDIYRRDGKIYTLPAEIKIMLIMGDKERINGITDLKTFAEAMEAIRAGHPDGPILHSYTEDILLRQLAMSSLPAMVKEDGSLDEAMLKEFLTQAKRIYQAEAAGVDPEEKEIFQKNMEDGFEEIEPYLMVVGMNSLHILTGDAYLLAGTLGSFDWDLSELVSLKDNVENIDIKPYNGMAENVFKPLTFGAVSVKSENQEAAGGLLQMMYSEETLDMPVRSGFAVNKNAIRNEMEKVNGYGGKVYGAMASSDEDGNYVELNMRGATQEELDYIMSLLEQARIPVAGYEVIENAIYEIGPSALNGTSTVEEAASQIMKKVAIYLAE